MEDYSIKLSEINISDKISLDGFIEQDLPGQCPECCEEMNAENIIGFGSYPKGGYRSMMKPNQETGVGYECPKCFSKSCFHADKFTYQMYLDVKKSNAL